MRGIGGATITVDKEGDTVFGIVGYHELAGMNILSIGEIIDDCEYIGIDRRTSSLLLQMDSEGPIYIFKRKRIINLFVI